MALLVDVNVLVALMHARHRHSQRAIQWLATQDAVGSIYICRVIQMGVLRLLTRKVVMQEDVLSPSEFWSG